jgi:hypothetical protein
MMSVMTAIDTGPDQLKQAVERMHGGKAVLAQSVPVREIFDGKTVWEGVVHVFQPYRSSGSYSRLGLVIADRGQHKAAVLRRTAYRPDQLAARGDTSRYRGRK